MEDLPPTSTLEGLAESVPYLLTVALTEVSWVLGGSGSIGARGSWPGLSLRASQLQRPGALPLPLPYWEVSSLHLTPPSLPLPWTFPLWSAVPHGDEVDFLAALLQDPDPKRRLWNVKGDISSLRENLWEVSVPPSSYTFLPAANVPLFPLTSEDTLLVPLQTHSFVPVLSFMSPPAPAALDLGWVWGRVCQTGSEKAGQVAKTYWASNRI